LIDLFLPIIIIIIIIITIYLLLRIVCILLYFHSNYNLISELRIIASHAVQHETTSTEKKSIGKRLVLLMLVTLSSAIESISEFCLPSRIRHGAGDEVLYPVIVFVVSM
jgi:hypothetical protein